MATLPPVPQDPIGECFVWRDWFSRLKDAISSSIGTFLQIGAGAVPRTIQSKLQDTISVADFGVVGDGVTDYTTAINQANVAATAAGKTLFWPAGTYIATNIPVISGMSWEGESSVSTILKLKTGTNAAFISSAINTNFNNVRIKHMRFDGNSAGNTTGGNTITIRGFNANLEDIYILNSAGTGLTTDWYNDGVPIIGDLGQFINITIDTPQHSGWEHYGPVDIYAESIFIIDAGVKTTNTYYGLYLAANGRFNNVHPYMRDTTTNYAIAGVAVSNTSYGSTFTNCHFESGRISLQVDGQWNTFEGCLYYAPRGAYCVTMNAGNNRLTGTMGVLAASSNPNYKGILLAGADNIIDVTDVGCLNGAIDFSSDPGNNFVRLAGYRATGTLYVGSPAATDIVHILVGGVAGGSLTQPIAGTGTVTSVAGTGTVSGITLTGTVTTTGNITLGGTYAEAFPGWSAPTLINSWANYGAPWATAGYYKDAAGRVHVRGGVTAGTAATNICQLPVGYRPTAAVGFATVSNAALGQIQVDTSGNIYLAAGSGTGVTVLDGISFQTN